MSLSRKTAVVGAYEHPTRFAPDKSMHQIMAESIRGALDDCGLTIKDVDGLLTAGMGMGGMAIVGFCDYLNLTPNFLDSTNIGGSSFVALDATGRSCWLSAMLRRSPARGYRCGEQSTGFAVIGCWMARPVRANHGGSFWPNAILTKKQSCGSMSVSLVRIPAIDRV